jgi:hypothetical protein
MKKTLNIVALGLTSLVVTSWISPSRIEAVQQQPAPKKKSTTTTKAAPVDPIKALYKNGGIIVWEKDGHGLVVAENDLNQPEEGMSQKDGKIACENLVLNGFSDWRLPTSAECELMRTNLCSKNIGNLRDPNGKPVPYTYWTSEKISGNPHMGVLYAFHNGLTSGFGSDGSNCCGGKIFRVRAVREF